MPTASDQYFETQITTATPQRLRLMLIEAVLRAARRGQEAWKAGRVAEGADHIQRCRDIVSELIAGIHPDKTSVAQQVLNIYLFVFSTLVEAQLTKDFHRLAEIIRVLEEERETWEQICLQMPEAPIADATASMEELAPQRVGQNWRAPYGMNTDSAPTCSGLSIEA